MTRLLSTFALLLALFTPAFAAPLPLEQFLHGPGMDGSVAGVEVCDARTGQVLFAHNAATRLLPASNAKLFTAAAALELLGEQYTWTTKVVSAQKPDAAGIVNGDVYLVGAGDASLVTADLDDLAKQIKAAGVKRVAGALYGDNSLFTDGPYGFGWEWDDFSDEEFPQISALTVDEGDAPFTFTAGEASGDPVRVGGEPYVAFAPVQATTEETGKTSDLTISVGVGSSRAFPLQRVQVFRNGTFMLTVSPRESRSLLVSVRGALPVGKAVQQNVPVDFPSRYTADVLTNALRTATVALVPPPQRLRTPSFAENVPPKAAVVLALHTSALLSQYVTHMLKDSDNLYAECLVRTVGVEAAKKGPPTPNSGGVRLPLAPPELGAGGASASGGTFAAGYAAERPALQHLGVDMTNVTLVDGCGVGRRNYVTARAVCQLLVGMKKSAHYAAFYNALPIAGVDGTLKSRLKGTPAAANCHAKTGTLGAVRALSGYVTGKNGTPYVFSILLNNFPGTARQAGAVQDSIVEWLAAH